VSLLLENLQPAKLEAAWGWPRKYRKIEPGFFGFYVKVDEAISAFLRS
jgi:hypothetical protein